MHGACYPDWLPRDALMPRLKLTVMAIDRAAAPAEGRLELWDTLVPGLGLRITSTGHCSWSVLTRVDRKLTRYTLGAYPVVGLADARAKARDLMQAIARGEPPSSRSDTVGEVVAEFVERYHRPRNKSWRAVDRALRRELAPWWGKPIRNVTKRDVITMLDRMVDRAPTMANRVHAYLRQLFTWAVETRHPKGLAGDRHKAPSARGEPGQGIDQEELAAVWRASTGLGWPAGPMVRLMILTAQRRGEVAAMAWEDVTVDRKIWTLPKAITKAGRAHDVPLSPLALEIIGGLPLVGYSGLVFPSRTGVIVNFSRYKQQLDRASGVAELAAS